VAEVHQLKRRQRKQVRDPHLPELQHVIDARPLTGAAAPYTVLWLDNWLRDR